MKPYLIIALFVGCMMAVSCSKESKTASSPLVFSSLMANADSVHVDSLLGVHAVATGDNLSYTWESTGNILGSGANVNFTICHVDVFNIKCTVTDNASNSASKTISVRTYNP